MKTNKLMILVLLTMVFAAILYAQGPGPGGPPDPATMVQHRVQHLTKMLSLTPEQQQQATTIFTNAATGAAGIHDSMKTAHQNLQTAIKNNDQNGITQASTTIGSLTSQMIAAEAKAHAAFYQILNPDQQSKMDQMGHHGWGHDGGRRHGFGGGPGMKPGT